MGEGRGLMVGDRDRAWSWIVYWLRDGGLLPTILASISPFFPGLSPP